MSNIITEGLRTTIERATAATLREAIGAVWAAYNAKQITDDEAADLDAVHHARHAYLKAEVATSNPQRTGAVPLGRVVPRFGRRRYQRSPDRAASIERSRRLAYSGPMPPALAARYSPAQLAVLRVVSDEVATHGRCVLCFDAIAARAGVCRRTAQIAIRLAEGDGMLTVQERPRQGAKSDTNVICIINREWQAWLRRGRRTTSSRDEGIGCSGLHPTNKVGYNLEPSVQIQASQRAAEKASRLPRSQILHRRSDEM